MGCGIVAAGGQACIWDFASYIFLVCIVIVHREGAGETGAIAWARRGDERLCGHSIFRFAQWIPLNIT